MSENTDVLSRSSQWKNLQQEVDLLVIGGGITGCGVARDAVKRGMKVALVEMNDLAFGTSSRSSKLVHGGLRYLEHYEFSLVFEAVSERRILMDLAPHLVNPLGFLFPVFDGHPHKLWFINAGMWLYDGLSLFRSPKIHKKLSAKEVETLVPHLVTDGLKGAPLYYDCSTDDARLTLENAIDAAEHGASVVPFCKAESFIKDENGRVCGAMVKDVFSAAVKEVRAKVVINATGPWTDRTITMSRPLESGPLLRPTKGVHIVVSAEKLKVPHAVVCLHPEDERVLFALPWGDETYIGTTDTDFPGDPATVAATTDDVNYLIDATNAYFTGMQICKDDVRATWAGLRPLAAPPPKEGTVDESAVSREHQIIVGQDGLLSIVGGKLTTFRRMSAEAVDIASRLLQLSGGQVDLEACSTEKDPLPGGVGWPDDDDHDKVASKIAEASGGAVDEEVGRLLADSYGMRALKIAENCKKDPSLAEPIIESRLEIMGQVEWACTHEFAASVSDVFIRRTQLFYRDVDQGLGAVEKVATRLQKMLGWSDDDKKQSIDAYQEQVAQSRAWRNEEPEPASDDTMEK
ncbi:MAG: glycerol-3-phosphate dehydrogenase [Deltaproteobacteria bacterium]|nr:glycerol-3-phosphate dehydrogenase [Deltaproteobacteria bacterium]